MSTIFSQLPRLEVLEFLHSGKVNCVTQPFSPLEQNDAIDWARYLSSNEGVAYTMVCIIEREGTSKPLLVYSKGLPKPSKLRFEEP